MHGCTPGTCCRHFHAERGSGSSGKLHAAVKLDMQGKPNDLVGALLRELAGAAELRT